MYSTNLLYCLLLLYRKLIGWISPGITEWHYELTIQSSVDTSLLWKFDTVRGASTLRYRYRLTRLVILPKSCLIDQSSGGVSSAADIAYLRTVLPASTEEAFFTYLHEVDTSVVTLYAIAEGSVVFPKVPVMRVEGPLPIVQLLETTLLNLVNYSRWGRRKSRGPLH